MGRRESIQSQLSVPVTTLTHQMFLCSMCRRFFFSSPEMIRQLLFIAPKALPHWCQALFEVLHICFYVLKLLKIIFFYSYMVSNSFQKVVHPEFSWKHVFNCLESIFTQNESIFTSISIWGFFILLARIILSFGEYWCLLSVTMVVEK